MLIFICLNLTVRCVDSVLYALSEMTNRRMLLVLLYLWSSCSSEETSTTLPDRLRRSSLHVIFKDHHHIHRLPSRNKRFRFNILNKPEAIKFHNADIKHHFYCPGLDHSLDHTLLNQHPPVSLYQEQKDGTFDVHLPAKIVKGTTFPYYSSIPALTYENNADQNLQINRLNGYNTDLSDHGLKFSEPTDVEYFSQPGNIDSNFQLKIPSASYGIPNEQLAQLHPAGNKNKGYDSPYSGTSVQHSGDYTTEKLNEVGEVPNILKHPLENNPHKATYNTPGAVDSYGDPINHRKISNLNNLSRSPQENIQKVSDILSHLSPVHGIPPTQDFFSVQFDDEKVNTVNEYLRVGRELQKNTKYRIKGAMPTKINTSTEIANTTSQKSNSGKHPNHRYD